MYNKNMKILLVEDERTLSSTLKEVLTIYNYEVVCAFDGVEALENVKESRFDLIIMDVMMPRLNGIDATKKIREIGISTPIIMLTAKSELDDKVDGLDAGADDYLAKPFQTKELLARIRALLRREGLTNDVTVFGDLTLFPSVYRIKTDSKSTYLTKKEFTLLEYLIRHQNRFTTTENILSDLWDSEKDVDITIVWVYISNLRKKLAEIDSKIKLQVGRGKGYKLEYVQKN